LPLALDPVDPPGGEDLVHMINCFSAVKN
jgi:hypothetical protein